MNLLNTYILIGERYAFDVIIPRPAFTGTIEGVVKDKMMIDGVLYIVLEGQRGLNGSHVAKCRRLR